MELGTKMVRDFKIAAGNCTAIINSTSDIAHFLTKLNNIFYKAMEKFITQNVQWILKYIPEFELQTLLNQFLESGINCYWKHWLEDEAPEIKRYRVDEWEDEPKFRPFGSNEMLAVVYVFAMVQLICVTVLLMEILYATVKRQRAMRRVNKPMTPTQTDTINGNRVVVGSDKIYRRYQHINIHFSVPFHYLP